MPRPIDWINIHIGSITTLFWLAVLRSGDSTNRDVFLLSTKSYGLTFFFRPSLSAMRHLRHWTSYGTCVRIYSKDDSIGRCQPVEAGFRDSADFSLGPVIWPRSIDHHALHYEGV